MKLKNNYFLLRHGESLKNKKDIAACWPEKFRSPLTEKGEKQVKKAAKALKKYKIDLIFSSDILRTKQTAVIAAKVLELKINFDKRLREVNVGVFNGRPINEIGEFYSKGRKSSALAHYSKRFKMSPLKGESYKDVQTRAFDFISELEKKYQGKNILVISHARVITLLEKAVFEYSVKKFVKIITGKKEIALGQVRKLALWK